MSAIHPRQDKAAQRAPVLPSVISILIVDDQRFDRYRIRRLCEALDFTVHLTEADTLAALHAALDADTFNLVCLDYNLPDGDGLEALDIVRSHPEHTNAATIMITGENQSDVAIEALKRGCNDYLVKDVLSEGSLRRATVNALQKAVLARALDTEKKSRVWLEQVLARFSSDCAREIKPMLGRMTRQMRDLKPAVAAQGAGAEAAYREIEQSCHRIWKFLEDLETCRGEDVAAPACAFERGSPQPLPPSTPPPAVGAPARAPADDGTWSGVVRDG